jgi:hypothetical protein
MARFSALQQAVADYRTGKRSQGYAERFISCCFVGCRSVVWFGYTWEARDKDGAPIARGTDRSVVLLG